MNEVKITQKEFELFRDYIYHTAGISLAPQKLTLVQSRLAKRVKQLKFQTFKDYYNFVLDDKSGEELTILIDSISTNVTFFFREEKQWIFLKDNINTIVSKLPSHKLRIWSAACSSGQEPYSIAIFLKEHLKVDIDIKILATDISTGILKRAQNGIYSEKEIDSVPKHLRVKYFDKLKNESQPLYKIKDIIKEMVIFRHFNLVHGDFSIFKNSFDIIFCRNVMIYFDLETQQKLVKNFSKLMHKNSYLFIGHSESLTKNSQDFNLIGSSIYIKR